jgi:hypothetical protein
MAMKHLFRSLLIAAAPFLLREIFKRLDARSGGSRRPRTALPARGR